MHNSHRRRNAGWTALAAGLALLALACSGGGDGTPARPRTATPVQAEVHAGVVPFDPARVRHWPGLPNVGASCFVNTHLKLVSAMAGLDPFLLEHPGDDAGARDVRGALLRVVNRIRSGQGTAADLGPQVDAVLAAYRAHPGISLHVRGASSTGDDAVSLTGAVLEVLGAGSTFQMRQVSKTLFRDPAAAPVYRAAGAGADALMVAPGDLTGRDFSGVRSVADAVRTVYGNPTRHPGGTNTAVYPVEVPGTLLLGVDHPDLGAGLALAFSERIQVPVYDVQPGARQETRVREAGLRARAAAVFRSGHFWAVVRGDDGWYAQNDANPSTRISDADLDETLNPSGAMERRLAQILFERLDP